MARVTVTTLEGSELARVKRVIEHKQQADQLGQFIAGAGNFVFRPQLLDLADKEVDAANPAYKAFFEKYKLNVTDDGVSIDFATGLVTKEVPDGSDSEPGVEVDSSTADDGAERDGPIS